MRALFPGAIALITIGCSALPLDTAAKDNAGRDGSRCSSNDGCKSKSCERGICGGSFCNCGSDGCGKASSDCEAGWICVSMDGIARTTRRCFATCGSCPPGQACPTTPGETLCTDNPLVTGPKVTIVAPMPPTPGASIEVHAGTTVMFRATATSPSQATIGAFTWRFVGEEKKGAEVTHTFKEGGGGARVSVVDEFGVTGEAEISVRVCQAAGTACNTFGGVANPCCTGLNCNGDASGMNYTCR